MKTVLNKLVICLLNNNNNNNNQYLNLDGVMVCTLARGPEFDTRFRLTFFFFLNINDFPYGHYKYKKNISS